MKLKMVLILFFLALFVMPEIAAANGSGSIQLPPYPGWSADDYREYCLSAEEYVDIATSRPIIPEHCTFVEVVQIPQSAFGTSTYQCRWDCEELEPSDVEPIEAWTVSAFIILAGALLF